MSHILLMWPQCAPLSQIQVLPLQGLLYSRQGRYKAQVLPHQGLLHARQARYRAKFFHSRAFCTPGRKDRQPEMTLPRPMGRSTPSPAGARTEHWSAGCLRLSGLVTPICQNGKTANVSRYTVREEYQTATHRTGEKRRHFQGRWHKAQRDAADCVVQHCHSLSPLPLFFVFFFSPNV